MPTQYSEQLKKLGLFVLKIVCIAALTYGAYQFLFWFLWIYPDGPNAYDNSYQRALLLQYETLDAPERDPSIIVFGASYVPFGIDVSVLSKETGRNAQTLGAEAGMGIRVLLDILYDTAKEGDTVVYMLGPSDGIIEDEITVSCALEANKDYLFKYWNSRDINMPRLRKSLLWRKIYSLCAANLIELIRSNISSNKQIYSLDSFDEHGNMTVLREGTRISTDVSPDSTLSFDEIDSKSLDWLNEFSLWCREQNITFIITYCPMIQGSLSDTEEDLEQYHRQLCDYLDADIIGKPADYFLPVEDFYNHPLHLNTVGAREYSLILAEKLTEYLEQNK